MMAGVMKCPSSVVMVTKQAGAISAWPRVGNVTRPIAKEHDVHDQRADIGNVVEDEGENAPHGDVGQAGHIGNERSADADRDVDDRNDA